MSADYQVIANVAVITLNNPPVNGLGLATRTAAVAALRRAQEDDAVDAIVITGAGKAFSGGADIKEFNSPKALTEPSLFTLIAAAESLDKPVVAAIQAVCMGGGLELALGCHYRVALPGAHIALPEVKLGLLPGAGGTQRLPRAVGLATALQMIVTGTPVLSEKLADSGLFDAVFPAGTDLVTAAVEFAHGIAAVRPLPKVRDRMVDAPDLSSIAAARDQASRAADAYPAPLACVETVAAAVTLPFDEGVAFERRHFMRLMDTTTSKALRHAFFSERLASKVPDVPADTAPRTIFKAAVVGAGTMGGGIAMTFANAGIPVMLLDTRQDALDLGLATIRKNYATTVSKGKLTQEKLAQRVALITGTLDYADIAGADIVVEAVFEDMAVKQAVFTQLDAVMKPGAILASNTSTLDLDRIAAFTQRPQDIVGTHFFSPANVMKLLEIVRGRATAKDALATVLALAKKLKKTGVVAGVCDGFIGNRMIEQYVRQAGLLLDEGALPAQVDHALEDFGFAMGPFRMSDLAGNDIGWAIRKRRAIEKPDMVYSKTADKLCELGRFGQKSGAGWYDYRAGDRTAHPAPVVDAMVVAHSASLGITRRAIADEEIVQRLVYALVNEGAQILGDGIAMRASDIDMVYLSGYGFPLYRGGPMFYADTVGLPAVLKAIEQFGWTPAPLLVKLAGAGKTFSE